MPRIVIIIKMESSDKKIYKKASFFARCLSCLIDELIFLITAVLFLVFSNISKELYLLLLWILIAVYNILFIWKSGATPGKKLLKLRVVDCSYQPVDFFSVLLRETIGKILSRFFFYLGYFWVLISKKSQSWHDKIAQTLVVKVNKNGQLIPLEVEEVTFKRKVSFVLLFLTFGFPLIFLALFIPFYLFIGQPQQIKGRAMLPNYQDGEYYFTNKISYQFSLPQRGEVVVFRSSLDSEVYFFKRIIGLPHEEVEIKNGKVYINQKILPEPYLPKNILTKERKMVTFGERIIIPDNHYFVLSDNRDYGADSRDWGSISRKDIIGKMSFCYWNCSEKKE